MVSLRKKGRVKEVEFFQAELPVCGLELEGKSIASNDSHDHNVQPVESRRNRFDFVLAGFFFRCW